MGLCKCPKKKVTNLFCYEHRVNVCEHCLVANHTKCIVQSYLKWLQDSDYNPDCPLCHENLATGECVRLICYDVFHWDCIDRYANSLPSNTAPAGYACPTCKNGIFPASNVVSPIADAINQKLSTVNWARAGLGLPLIEEPESTETDIIPASVNTVDQIETKPALPSFTNTPSVTRPSAQVSPYNTTPTATSSASNTVISVDGGTTSRAVDKGNNSAPRKLFDSQMDDEVVNMSQDHDEDKYKRRSAMTWLQRWFKSRDSKKRSKDPDEMMKRFLIVLVIGLIGFLTVIIIFSRLGRRVTDDDPFLDPMANPNIRVHEVPQGKVI